MKSADVGPCPPANQSPHFDRWSSIYKNSDRSELREHGQKRVQATHDFRMSRKAGQDETGFKAGENESDERTEDERRPRGSYAENELVHEQRHDGALGIVCDYQGEIQSGTQG